MRCQTAPLIRIVLGPKRLPDAGRSIGRGLREFKGAISGDDDEHVPREREPPAIGSE